MPNVRATTAGRCVAGSPLRLALVAVSGPGTVGAVDTAVAAGIPVINVNALTDSDKVVTRIRMEGSQAQVALVAFDQADGDRSEMRITRVSSP